MYITMFRIDSRPPLWEKVNIENVKNKKVFDGQERRKGGMRLIRNPKVGCEFFRDEDYLDNLAE